MQKTNLFDLSGRVAAVTGGNGGIGRGIALGLAEAGASVAILARNEKKNAAVVAEIEANGGRAWALPLDVSDRSQLRPAIEKIEDVLGPIDILVNNAGITAFGGVLDLSPEEWDRVLETNLTSCFLLGKYAAESMRARKRGKIVNIASIYGVFGSALIPSYNTAKGGLLQLTRSMAIELAPHNIQVNAIAPGWIDTEMTDAIKNTPLHKETVARTPAGRWGTASELAGAAIFLASEASSFVTGATLFVDGGYSIY